MINFDNIENSLRHEIADDNGDGSCDLTNTALLELITLLRQAEKDAARYRMIKSIAKVIECEEFDMDMLDGQDLDAMVDECIEAMQCK